MDKVYLPTSNNYQPVTYYKTTKGWKIFYTKDEAVAYEQKQLAKKMIKSNKKLEKGNTLPLI